ncbi:class II aldolase/adducin family protein [[Clostridium] hylemonae]|nr:class II aldolase/adducin family protein [[Clostridium] hylemonae]QEK16051.1 Methylthioribulose-1-phosphate dehydratase [[Clostridium] hylemonae DSM 15053]
MEQSLETCFEEAVRAAGLLFDRNKVTGSTGNISFRYGGNMYISGNGTCFGWLGRSDFAVIDSSGRQLSDIKPSKEYPLHKIIYDAKPEIHAVIHTHSFYSTLVSCMADEQSRDVFSDITPYLRMKVGTIGMIPRAVPGSAELFDALAQRVHDSGGYLLADHGPLIGGTDIRSAFYGIEEIEETSKIHYYLQAIERRE